MGTLCRRFLSFLVVSVLLGLFFASVASAQSVDEPFTFPSLFGYTGLMETPTARVMTEERWRSGASYVKPYRVFYVTLTPLERFEVNARIVEFEGIKGFTDAYGYAKDRAVDLKYQVVPEGKFRPAIALGFMDPTGTRRFGSNYLVASKQIYPFDFTVGFGDGRFGTQPLDDGGGFRPAMVSNPNRWISDGRFFGGVQFVPSERFAFMAEYSPIDYSKHVGARLFRDDPPSSKYNFGMRWQPLSWATVDLSWQRGNQVGLGLSTVFDMGRPFIPIYDPPYRELSEHRTESLELRAARALSESGFSDIGVLIRDDTMWVDARNDTYFFPARAFRVMVDVLTPLVPDEIHQVHIILKEKGVPLARLSVEREDMRELGAGRLTANQFLYLAELETDISSLPAGEKQFQRAVDFSIQPVFRFYVSDPSGFFRYRLGAALSSEARIWTGGSFVAGVSAYPVNTVTTTAVPDEQAVRSDIGDYMDESVVLERLMAEQIVKLPGEVHLMGAVGILESMYTGLDAEAALPLFDGRILVGVSGSIVKKRKSGSFLSLHDSPSQSLYRTAFANARLNVPEQNAWFDVKAGRFLAGDMGARFTATKCFGGLTLSAWYGITDTSRFDDASYNRGYRDKGLALSIPLRFFRGSDSRTSYSLAVSPWTRDVAQDVSRHRSLFDYMGRNTKIFLDRDRENF